MAQESKTVVIKIGTSSLTERDGSLSKSKLGEIVRQVAELKDRGENVLIVTSGSIAAGFRRLGHTQRPKTIAAKQAAAAVGQGLLMEEYANELLKYGYVGAQLLLTRGDFTDKRRYDNVFSALGELLKFRAVPIINENDTTSIEELRFGDNDTLSAQVAAMLHADLLVLLTDIDGLYTADPRKDKNAEHIDFVDAVTPDIEALGFGAASENSSGGMKSKIRAAALATAAGVPVFIASSAGENAVIKAFERSARGTYFAADGDKLKTRLQWVAFYTEGKGRLYIDSGAEKALTENGKSLLPSGIVAIEGEFLKGEVVDVYSSENRFLGRGISGYDKQALALIKGRHLSARQAVAIHRSNWVAENKILLIRGENDTEESGMQKEGEKA